MTAWTDLVKKTYAGNKSKPGYKLGDAMRDAKKLYKKGGTVKNEEEVQPKKNKTRKNKSRRKSRK